MPIRPGTFRDDRFFLVEIIQPKFDRRPFRQCAAFGKPTCVVFAAVVEQVANLYRVPDGSSALQIFEAAKTMTEPAKSNLADEEILPMRSPSGKQAAAANRAFPEGKSCSDGHLAIERLR